MALGKKSFLIRDILESNSQPWTTDQQIVDWLLSSRTNELSRVEKSPLTEALDVDESHINNASLPWDLQPFIQNWLAIQAGSGSVMNLAENGYHDLWPAAWSDLEASWHLGADNIGNDLRPTSSVMVQAHSQLYRHLYYAALQQQMNATSEASKSLVETNPCTLMSPLAKPCASPTNSTLASGQSNSIRRRASKRNAEEGLCKSKKKVFKVSQAQNSSKKKEKHKHSNLMDVNTEATKPVNGTNVDETTWTNLVESDIDDVEASNASDETTISSYRKLRRNRTVFTELQLMGLERRFDSQKYLSTPDRADLAQALGLTQLQVKTWYQNRRMKWKKQVMQNGCPYPPTKPKGRPKKDSIPTYGIEFTNQILCPIFASHNSNTV